MAWRRLLHIRISVSRCMLSHKYNCQSGSAHLKPSLSTVNRCLRPCHHMGASCSLVRPNVGPCIRAICVKDESAGAALAERAFMGPQ